MGTSSRRGARRLFPIVLLIVILVIGFGSVRYLSAFKVDREPKVVIVGVTRGAASDLDRLAQAFSAGAPGYAVKTLASGAGGEIAWDGDPDQAGDGGGEAGVLDAREEARMLATLLKSGWIDCLFAEADSLRELGLPLAGPVFRQATLISVLFPSAHQSVTLDEASSIVTALTAGNPGPWPQSGLALLGLADRSPDRQLLEVAGVYPTAATVLDGRYPLTKDIGLAVRSPRGLAGLVGGLPLLGSWLQPNREAVDLFLEWMGSEEARAAFYGSEITLAAVGDVMLARKTQREIDQYGLDYPFKNVAERLSSADLTFCNLEAPLGDTGRPIPGKVIWLRGRPEFIECLKLAGFDVISVCNNHILDYDSPCMLQTLDLLDEAGIAYVGGGRNIEDARTPRIVEAGGLKLGFIGYTEFADSWLFWDYSYRRTFLADEDVPGCNPLDMTLVAADIARAKEMGADLVVVSYHWGWEDILYPAAFNPKNDLEAIARRTIDLGASVVLGHHPHIVQGFEVYRGGVIAYSLGNFVNDQAKPHQKEGTILELQIGPSGVLSARITPVWIESTAPRFMTGDEKKAMMEKIERISVGFRSRQ